MKRHHIVLEHLSTQLQTQRRSRRVAAALRGEFVHITRLTRVGEPSWGAIAAILTASSMHPDSANVLQRRMLVTEEMG
jgi:menaquinone-dependent protoporphyrinogen IX oxidase